MTEPVFEDALRATLRAAAPGNVPARLEDRARAIPRDIPVRPRWPSVRPERTRAAIAAMLLVAIAGASIVLVAPRSTSEPGGGPANPVRLASSFGALLASDLELVVDGRTFRVPSSLATAGVEALTLTGTSTYGRLTIEWRDGDHPMTLVVHLAADAQTWWVSEIVATDGRSEAAGWLYFEGPLLERPLGTAFDGTVELASVRSTYGETSSLRFGHLSLRAFSGSPPRNPAVGTMPPFDGTGAAAGGPDFIPMVGGTEVVGYVPRPELEEPVPINSFRGQSPDQPVYAADLKTLVGYSVPGGGFAPLPTKGTPPTTAPPAMAGGSAVTPSK